MVRLAFLWILICSVLSCTPPVSEKIPDSANQISTEIHNYLTAHANNQKFNGSVLITYGDSIVIIEHYGLANREKKVAINDSTKFLIGSITKPFTALAILLLEQEGKLSVDDKLSDYYPDFPMADSVTLHQLLTHTSGIRDYHFFQDWKERSQAQLTPLDVIEQVKTDPYRFAPGTNFRYSNTGYIFLGLIIERVSGDSFEEYVQKAILSPLKLKQTGIIHNDTLVENLAHGYQTTPRETKDADYINYNQPFSSGNMYSTVWDLKRFTDAVVNSELIPASKTKEIFENNSGYYGYGWGIRDFDGTQAYGHHGGMNGYWGTITYIPESETFIAILTNDDNTPKYTINRDLVKLLNGDSVNYPEPYTYRTVKPETISEIVGSYLVKPGDTLKVYDENDRVFLQETGQMSYELFQVGEERFVMTMQEFDVSFNRDSIYFSGMVNSSAPKLVLIEK